MSLRSPAFSDTLDGMKKLLAKSPKNWAGAFTSFCQGAPFEEIAQIFEIELTTLTDHAQRERWVALRATLPLGTAPAVDKEMTSVTQIKLAAIQANRDANLKAWAKLRDDAIDIIDRLRAGKLKVQKQWHNRGLVTEAEAEVSLADRVNLATYLRTVSEGTYRALGDMSAQEKPGQDQPGGSAPNAPAITIILPMVIAAPRDQREKDTVIDLRDTATPSDTITAELKSANPESGSLVQQDSPPGAV
jgi:hypothetical protein